MSWELVLGIFVSFAVIGAISGWFRAGDRQVRALGGWLLAALLVSLIGMLTLGSSFSDALLLLMTNGMSAAIAITVDALVHRFKTRSISSAKKTHRPS